MYLTMHLRPTPGQCSGLCLKHWGVCESCEHEPCEPASASLQPRDRRDVKVSYIECEPAQPEMCAGSGPMVTVDALSDDP
jgi:hypothetical protein